MQENPFKDDHKNYCTFYIVRHGETQWNVDRKIQGHRNSPLTKEGLKQIKEIAKELRKIKFHTVFSSDLLRAKRTAEVVALEHNLAVHTTKLLRERRYGKYEGKPSEVLTEFHKLFDRLTTAERMAYKISQDVESDNEMIARFITFLREVAIVHKGKNVMVTTHGGMMRVLLVHLGLGTYQDLFVKSIRNTAYVKLLTDGVDFFIQETKGINKNNSLEFFV